MTITFDRPVAGSLDRTVDPKGIFRIEPSLAGLVDWRDRVTLRFRPAVPLPANRSFRVTVSDRFEAMDGSRLAAPFVHSFRVRGSRILAGTPVGPSERGRYLTPDSRFDLVLDAPVDSSVAPRCDGRLTAFLTPRDGGASTPVGTGSARSQPPAIRRR